MENEQKPKQAENPAPKIETGVTAEGIKFWKHFDQNNKLAYTEFEDGSMQMFDEEGNVTEHIDPSGKLMPIETKKTKPTSKIEAKKVEPAQKSPEEPAELTAEEIHKMYLEITESAKKRGGSVIREILDTGLREKTVTELENTIKYNEKLIEQNEAARKEDEAKIIDLRKFLAKLETPEEIQERAEERAANKEKKANLLNEIAKLKVTLKPKETKASFEGSKTEDLLKEIVDLKKLIREKEEEWAELHAELVFEPSTNTNEQVRTEMEAIIAAKEEKNKQREAENRQLLENLNIARAILKAKEEKVVYPTAPEKKKETKTEMIAKLREIIERTEKIIAEATRELEIIEKRIALAKEKAEEKQRETAGVPEKLSYYKGDIKNMVETFLNNQPAITGANVKVKGEKEQIIMVIDLEAKKGKTIKGRITAFLENRENSISVKGYQIHAGVIDTGIIKAFLGSKIDRIPEIIQNYISKETGKRVKKIEINDIGDLVVTFENS